MSVNIKQVEELYIECLEGEKKLLHLRNYTRYELLLGNIQIMAKKKNHVKDFIQRINFQNCINDAIIIVNNY